MNLTDSPDLTIPLVAFFSSYFTISVLFVWTSLQADKLAESQGDPNPTWLKIHMFIQNLFFWPITVCKILTRER